MTELSPPVTSVGSRRNLVALARPYFGLIVLATLLLAVCGVLSMLQHAQRDLSRGGLSADRGDRPRRPGWRSRTSRWASRGPSRRR